jgi:hypothetical protein
MASWHERFTYQGLLDYFEDIASKNKMIQSFNRRDHEEILNKIGKSVNLPAMVMDPPAAGKVDMDASNVQDAWDIVFEILKERSTKSASPHNVENLVSSCKEIADQVVSYLRNESRNNRLPGFDTASVEGSPIMYENDGFYGWETRLRILVPVDVSFDDSQWDLPVQASTSESASSSSSTSASPGGGEQQGDDPVPEPDPDR